MKKNNCSRCDKIPTFFATPVYFSFIVSRGGKTVLMDDTYKVNNPSRYEVKKNDANRFLGRPCRVFCEIVRSAISWLPSPLGTAEGS